MLEVMQKPVQKSSVTLLGDAPSLISKQPDGMKNVKPFLSEAFKRVIPIAFLTLVLCLPIGVLFRMAAFHGCYDTLKGLSVAREFAPEIPVIPDVWGDPDFACPQIGADTAYTMIFGDLFPVIWLVLFLGSYIKYPYAKE